MKRLTGFLTVTGAASLLLLLSCGDNAGLQSEVDELQKKVDQYEAEKKLVAERLVRFDSLDFDIYSNQKWDSFQISHADNIVVTYPDGHKTTDIATHLTELKPQFVFAPDTKIKSHQIKFGSVVGEMEGTFSQPMPVGNGKFIQPTGKKFKLQMCTVGQWKHGKMIAEILFWDNAAFMKQIGL
jgi:hypothetical protein